MSARIVIDVDRDGWTKGLQLNIVKLDENDSGWGYRLKGPKYNGSSKNLLRHELTERDAREIRECLDAAFPVPALHDAKVDRETAAHVVHMFGHSGGYPAGNYMGAVLTLIARSDVHNRSRFALAFPAQAEAVRMASDDEGGIERLQTIAKGGAK